MDDLIGHAPLSTHLALDDLPTSILEEMFPQPWQEIIDHRLQRQAAALAALPSSADAPDPKPESEPQ
jgi:hypothetical protein